MDAFLEKYICGKKARIGKTYETYGVLITVLSLLLMIIYAKGQFDRWDALIGTIGLIFSFGYIVQKTPDLIFEAALIALIFGISSISIRYALSTSVLCSVNSSVANCISDETVFWKALVYSGITLFCYGGWRILTFYCTSGKKNGDD